MFSCYEYHSSNFEYLFWNASDLQGYLSNMNSLMVQRAETWETWGDTERWMYVEWHTYTTISCRSPFPTKLHSQWMRLHAYLCPHFEPCPSFNLFSTPTKNVSKAGSCVDLPQYPGFYCSTPGSIFRFLKTGIRSYSSFWKQETGILQKPEHNQHTSVHVNALNDTIITTWYSIFML